MRGLPAGEHSSIASVVNIIVSAILHFRGESGLEYENAVTEMDEYLSERNMKTVIILDSVEEYPLHDHQFCIALKGLLRCAGAYGGRFRDLRIGIPAELYYDLQNASSNIMKDFDNAMVLHWSPMELLRLVAWRYLIFLAAFDESRLNKFASIDLNERSDVHTVLDDFFPKEIINRAGSREIGIAYALRHTQLLPRQIVKIFNEAFSTSRPSALQNSDDVVDSLMNAVQRLELDFCKEIYGAFRAKYPFASDLCEECLPSLPRFFDEKTLEKIYREKGKKVIQEFSHVGEVSFRDFKQSLFEIGAIGRVCNRPDSNIYADAEFEYALPGKLYASSSDELCLHPTFSGAYETNSNRNSDHFVYPHMQLYEKPTKRVLRI